jgi:hypothetical protein
MATETTKKIPQAEAMRQALTDLGTGVKNHELAEYAKSKFGVEFDLKYISQLKSAAKTKLGLKGKKGGKKRGRPVGSTSSKNGAPPADSPPATPPGVSPKLRHNLHDILVDMEAVRGIADRIGGDGVRRLLSLLGK